MTESILYSQTNSCPKCGAGTSEPNLDRICKLAPGKPEEDVLAVCIHADLMKNSSEQGPCDNWEHWAIVENDPGTFVAHDTEADGTTVNIHRCRQCNTLFKFRVF